MTNLTLEVSGKLQKFLTGPKKLYINGQFVESASKKPSPRPILPQDKNLPMYLKPIKKTLI